MNKLFYPAIFHTAKEGGFWVTFPDFPECMTQGDDMSEAYDMAVDALGLCIVSRVEDHNEIPSASAPDAIEYDGQSFVVLIEFDMLAYKKRTNSAAVKKLFQSRHG